MSSPLRSHPNHLDVNAGLRPAPNRSTHSWLIWSIFCAAFVVTGCASQVRIEATTKAAVSSGEKTLVLLRVLCTLDDLPIEVFSTKGYTPVSFGDAAAIVRFGLGSFDSVGEPRVTTNYFLSEKSRRQGWTYFLLTPEIYYLAVLGPDSDADTFINYDTNLLSSPRWRLDVPDNVRSIYAGTIHLKGKSGGKLLFGGTVIKPVNPDEIEVTDDYELARLVVAEHYPDALPSKAVTLQRWNKGDTVFIHTPARRQVSD